MITNSDRMSFVGNVIGDSLLENAIDWIKDNIPIDEVFTETQITDWCGANSRPQDVFSFEELTEWAEDNGFEKSK